MAKMAFDLSTKNVFNFNMYNLTQKQVIFDLFGTLIQFGVHHHPFRQLLSWARENGRKPKPDDARTIMTVNGDIDAVSAVLGIDPPRELLTSLNQLIDEELASLSLFSDVLPTLNMLRDQNIKIGICSNLAKPYGRVIDDLLYDFDLKLFLSYEIGSIKPEPEIYRNILKEFSCSAQSCLFVGDTLEADYLGSINAGMSAFNLQRNAGAELNQVTSLMEIFTS